MRIAKVFKAIRPAPAGCRCSHDRAAHSHYRRGTDCALCGPSVCDRFRTVRRHINFDPTTATAVSSTPPAPELTTDEPPPFRAAV